jgi:hypothetical protein
VIESVGPQKSPEAVKTIIIFIAISRCSWQSLIHKRSPLRLAYLSLFVSTDPGNYHDFFACGVVDEFVFAMNRGGWGENWQQQGFWQNSVWWPASQTGEIQGQQTLWGGNSQWGTQGSVPPAPRVTRISQQHCPAQVEMPDESPRNVAMPTGSHQIHVEIDGGSLFCSDRQGSIPHEAAAGPERLRRDVRPGM